MLVTEEQAKTMWCPMARVGMYVRGDAPDMERPVDLVGHGCNRMVTDDAALNKSIQTAMDGTGGTKCLGSACMWWRWGPRPFEATAPLETPYGLCGMAGSPS